MGLALTTQRAVTGRATRIFPHLFCTPVIGRPVHSPATVATRHNNRKQRCIIPHNVLTLKQCRNTFTFPVSTVIKAYALGFGSTISPPAFSAHFDVAVLRQHQPITEMLLTNFLLYSTLKTPEVREHHFTCSIFRGDYNGRVVFFVEQCVAQLSTL